MPQPQGPNRIVRLIVPLVALGIGLIFILSFANNGPRPDADGDAAQTGSQIETPQDGAQTGDGDKAPVDDETTSNDDESTTNTDTTEPDIATTNDDPPPQTADNDSISGDIEFKAFDNLGIQKNDAVDIQTLGSIEEGTDFKMEAIFTQWGAGISGLKMAEYKNKVGSDEPLALSSRLTVETNSAGSDQPVATDRVYTFAARHVIINGTQVFLDWYHGARWKQVSPGVFEMVIEDAEAGPVLKITRTYVFGKGDSGYDLICRQSFENLSDRPLKIVWNQVGTVDLEQDKSGYDRDYRAFAAGYYDLKYDPNRGTIRTDGAYVDRRELMNRVEAGGPGLWPNDDVDVNQAELLWVGNVNRHFSTVIHKLLPEGTEPDANGKVIVPRLDVEIENIGVAWVGPAPSLKDSNTKAYLTLQSRPMVIQPGGGESLDLALYAGPRDARIFDEPPYDWFGFHNLIVYSFGCPCTFAWLAELLIGFLRLIESFVLDWGVAIIILVACVRALLHPITKKGQINMMKMGKAMQALQPEMEKLKKKYENDQQKLQAEMMKLYREKGVNPLNMLGCLPMFLQTPIWIALYAMLYFAIELRHESAFYGLFQEIGAILGFRWDFLADLSGQDNFVNLQTLGWDFNIPVPFFGDIYISSFNILPILWVFVLMINQKLTTPPPVTEQAAQQQKMMRFMTMLFPIFLYKAPCGLTLYILTSTFAGIVDSWIVRRHIKREEEAGTLLQPKDPDKKGGCFGGKLGERFQEAMELQQQRMQEQQKQQQKSKGPVDKRKRRKR